MPLDDDSPELVHAREELSIPEEVEFKHCKIIGECLINGFENIEEAAFAEFAGATSPNSASGLSRGNWDSDGTVHDSLVDHAFVFY
jgi:hypothetical protein